MLGLLSGYRQSSDRVTDIARTEWNWDFGAFLRLIGIGESPLRGMRDVFTVRETGAGASKGAAYASFDSG